MKPYLSLTKPGIIFGNAVTATGGFFLASHGYINNLGLFLAMFMGLVLIVASGCVFNCYFDRDIDAMMERTRSRPLVSGVIPARHAIVFGCILLAVAILVFIYYTNPITLGVALFGFFVYVCVYTLWFKRRSVHSTLMGALAGATPPVIGYTAATHHIDTVAIILFIILITWQMPHFFAIALYRLNDYTAAKIPVLPAKRGVLATKFHILFYINAFLVAVLALTAFGYTGYVYAMIMGLLAIVWIALAILGFKASDTKKWARKMFFFSLLVIVLFSILIGIKIA